MFTLFYWSTTYCDNAGMPDALQDILFGNSAKVREASYKMRRKGFKTTEAYLVVPEEVNY